MFEYKNHSSGPHFSFSLFVWTDLITCILFSLFIQPALCFSLPCFIYGSHVLWLQLQGGFLKAQGSVELFHRQSMCWIVFILQWGHSVSCYILDFAQALCIYYLRQKKNVLSFENCIMFCHWECHFLP